MFTSGSHTSNTGVSSIQKTATAPPSSQLQNTPLTHTPPFQKTAPVTSSKEAPSPVVGHTPVPTVPITPVTYPTIMGSYAGTAGDILGQMKTTLTLTNIVQNQGAINGSFAGWQIQNSFSGFIDSIGHIHFTVTDSANHTQLTFDGNIQSAISLSGNYTSCSISGNRCQPQTGGVGLWQASRF